MCFLCLPFLIIIFEKFFRVQTDWIKIRPNVRSDLGPSYLQRLSADNTRKVGKKVNQHKHSFLLWDIVKPDATERVVSTIRVQTVWIQIRPDQTPGLIWVKHVCAKINSRWQLASISLLSFCGQRQTV